MCPNWGLQALALPEPLTCVPLAPGVIATATVPDPTGRPTPEVWAQAAAPFLLQLDRGTHNGSSVTVPGFYTDTDMASWLHGNTTATFFSSFFHWRASLRLPVPVFPPACPTRSLVLCGSLVSKCRGARGEH